MRIFSTGDIDTLSIDETSDLAEAKHMFDTNNFRLSLNGKFDERFLSEFKDVFNEVSQLHFFNWIEADMAFLYSLHNLTELSFSTIFNEVDFSKLPQLSSLGLPWHGRKFINLTEQKKLRLLLVTEYDEENLEPIKELNSIAGLYMASAKCTSLKGIESLTGLRALSIGAFRRLKDISDIGGLSNLACVEFHGCPKMFDFSPLGKLENLETIYMVDCRNLASIKFIGDMPKLKNLMLMGSTVINDFDLLPAKELEIVYAYNKKYNINLDEKALPGGSIGFYQYLG